MNVLKNALIVLAGLYALLVLVAWGAQRYLVYVPDPTRVDPAALALPDVGERLVEAPDGVSVVAWYAPARQGRPTLLYFHGNGGNLANRSEVIRRFMAEGLGVYMMSYRGYSGSGGTPSESNNVADARRAYADLRGLGIVAGDVVLYGESLGSGVAAQVALDAVAAGLILEAPFTSIVDIGAQSFPFLPVRWLMTHRYETIGIIDRVRMPLLVVHGEADRIVPVAMGREVFSAAAQAAPKRLVTLPGAGHNDHMRYGSFEAIMSFVREVGKPRL